MPTNGHDMEKPDGVHVHSEPKIDDNHPGYELQDVNVGGVATFLAALFGSVLVFFVFCFFMGKAIDYQLVKLDGPVNKWHKSLGLAGSTPRGEKREDLMSDAVMQQRAEAAVAQSFPTPRLAIDNGEQDTADLHAREDLLLNHYSTSADLPAGTIRIPIQRAMQLVLDRGLGASASAEVQQPLMFGDSRPVVTAPLTNGFARTGFELDTIEARNQRNDYAQAVRNEK